MTHFETVKEWIQIFDADHSPELWLKLIREEYQELEDAISKEDEIGIADALADLQWVMHGYSYSLRHDPDTMFAEIARSNFTKLGINGKPIKREDGKIMKGPNYSPPNLEPFIQAAKKKRENAH